jgi:hypothetical protein
VVFWGDHRQSVKNGAKLMKPMDHAEEVAKLILEAAIPGAEMKFRVEQAHMEYDFDLRYPNGEEAAVEVTSSRDQTTTRTHKEIFERGSGAEIKAVCCKKNWCIRPSVGIKKDFREHVDKYLYALEVAGIDGFTEDDCRKSNAPKEITAIYRDLNVIDARSSPTSGAAVIRMFSVFGGGQLYQTSSTSAAAREIEPNKDKLGKATTKERHLVVYVDKTNDQQWIAMTSSEPPNEIPNLPTNITHLWQIAETGENQFVVWRATSTEPWQTVEL